MRTRVRVVFIGILPDRPTWPYINYDVDRAATQVMARLREALPEVAFQQSCYYTVQEAQEGYETVEKGHSDGWLVYVTQMWTGIPAFYAENVRPVVIADELYSGSGGFLRTRSLIESHDWPVATVASSDFQDVVDAVRLLDVVHKMRSSRVLVISNRQPPGAASPAEVQAVEETFGTRTILMSGNDLQAIYESIPKADACPIRDRWIAEAQEVIEPDADEILRSARMYLATKQAMAQHQADAVSIDCLSLFYSNQASAYPCLTFFQLNNDGSTGVCEGDLHSVISQLLFRYLTGRPGYVSDPVIDEAAGQIIYAHCVATNRPFGPDGPGNPYIIRSHAEDHKGASVQSLLPLGQTVTSMAVSPQERAMGLYTAKTVANVNEEKACRTKLAAEVDVQRVLANYHFELFSWHQVTCYGDHRHAMQQLARLYGLRLIELDR